MYRWMTSCCILDYNTIAAADKFGNIAVVCDDYIHLCVGSTDLWGGGGGEALYLCVWGPLICVWGEALYLCVGGSTDLCVGGHYIRY